MSATTAIATPAAAAAAVPKAQFDWRPLALLVGLMGLALPAIGTPSTWQVDTDRGPTELVLKVEEDIRRLPGQRRLLITSAHGVVFDIPDRNALDRVSRRYLERFL